MTPSSRTRTTGEPAYASSSSARRSAQRLHVTGGEQPAPHGQQMRDEADREAERLLDLRRVLVRADAVRREVLEDEARVRRRLQPAAGARDAGLRVDDDARRVDRAGERREREQRRGRVTAGVRDERRLGREELGQPVAPRAGLRMLEAVPLGVERRVAEAMRAGEVDDDLGVRRLERGRLLVPEADEDDVRAGRERLGVRDERRQVAVQARVERSTPAARRASRSRARPARARGARAGGRASPGPRIRRNRGWRRWPSRIVCQKIAIYAELVDLQLEAGQRLSPVGRDEPGVLHVEALAGRPPRSRAGASRRPCSRRARSRRPRRSSGTRSSSSRSSGP